MFFPKDKQLAIRDLPLPSSNIGLTNTHYEILGVPLTASSEEIRLGYQTKIRKHYPTDCKQSVEKYMKILKAYRVLKDSKKRKKYDSLLDFAECMESFGETLILVSNKIDEKIEQRQAAHLQNLIFLNGVMWLFAGMMFIEATLNSDTPIGYVGVINCAILLMQEALEIFVEQKQERARDEAVNDLGKILIEDYNSQKLSRPRLTYPK